MIYEASVGNKWYEAYVGYLLSSLCWLGLDSMTSCISSKNNLLSNLCWLGLGIA
jgi:hypothetical protein